MSRIYQTDIVSTVDSHRISVFNLQLILHTKLIHIKSIEIVVNNVSSQNIVLSTLKPL